MTDDAEVVPTSLEGGNSDHVDHMVEQWSVQRPDLNMTGVHVIGRISRLARHFEREIESSLEPYGLNGAGFYVLAALRRSGPPYRLSPTQLYSSLLVSSGTMTNRLERLKAGGLIMRVPDPNDGRSSLVALTPRGRRLIDRAMDGHTANEIAMLAGLCPDDLSKLAVHLRGLLLILGDRPDEVVRASNSRPRPVAKPAGWPPGRHESHRSRR